MLRRVSSCTRRDHDTSPFPLPSQIAQTDLHEVDHSPIVDVDHPVLRLLQVAVGIEGVGEIIRLFADAGVGDADVDMAGGLEDAEDLGPGGDVGFEEGGVRGEGFVGFAEVEDVDGGAVGGEDLDGSETDAIGAAYEGSTLDRYVNVKMRTSSFGNVPVTMAVLPSREGISL